MSNHQIHLTISLPNFAQIRKLVTPVAILATLSLVLLGSVLAVSTKIKLDGDKEYTRQNYTGALQKYNAARGWWFLEKINYKLRNRDLHTKIIKADVMVKSAENYNNGVDAFNNKRYPEAKRLFASMALKDPNFLDAENMLGIIDEQLKPAPISPTSASVKISTQIDCTGPDGKQFKTTESECRNLKTAWAKISYLELNKNYISGSGLTVRITNISKSEESGSNIYEISYTQENRTNDKKIDEGYLMLVLDDDSKQVQYGFFSSLFPGDSKSKTYKFQILKTQNASGVEFYDNSEVNLRWKIDK